MHASLSRTHTPTHRCVLQWELSGASAGEGKLASEGLKDVAEAVAEEESDGYVLDLRDGSDLDRGSDFEVAAEERRAPVRTNILLSVALATVNDQGREFLPAEFSIRDGNYLGRGGGVDIGRLKEIKVPASVVRRQLVHGQSKHMLGWMTWSRARAEHAEHWCMHHSSAQQETPTHGTWRGLSFVWHWKNPDHRTSTDHTSSNEPFLTYSASSSP